MPGYCFERMNCRNDAILLALCPCLTYMYTHTRTRIHPHISQKHCTLRHFTLLPKFFRLQASWHMCSTLLLSYMPGAFSPGHGGQGGHSWLLTFLNMISISLMRAWLCSGFTMILSFQLDVVTLSSLCADIHERCHQGQSGQYLGVGGGNAYPHGHRF